MNKNLLVILSILFIPLVAYFILSKNVEDSSAVAKAQMPQLIKFTSSMCYDCQRLEGVVKEVFPNYTDRVALTEINVQNNASSVQTIIKKYKVKLVPTSIFVDNEGNIKNKVEGFINKTDLENYLNEIANNG